MEFLFIFVAIIVVGYLVLNKTNHKLKATSQTKQEIIARYEKELQDLLKKTQDDNQKKEQKAAYLKKCNNELSRNIFFTPEESKKILQKLASL